MADRPPNRYYVPGLLSVEFGWVWRMVDGHMPLHLMPPYLIPKSRTACGIRRLEDVEIPWDVPLTYCLTCTERNGGQAP